MPEPAVVLLIEDLEDDQVLICRAFDKAGIPNPLLISESGNEAIEYLSGVGPYANRAEYPLPDLILLDLKLPGMDGFEVLAWIRQQPGFRNIPVVVLTSSDHMNDVTRAYSLGANSFMVKPIDFHNYTELSKLLSEYWLRTVRKPQSSRPLPRRIAPPARS